MLRLFLGFRTPLRRCDFDLVPKVLFGNELICETLFRKQTDLFCKCVPKQSLGTRANDSEY